MNTYIYIYIIYIYIHIYCTDSIGNSKVQFNARLYFLSFETDEKQSYHVFLRGIFISRETRTPWGRNLAGNSCTVRMGRQSPILLFI